MPGPDPSALTLRCDNCKASIEISGLGPRVRCAYCGNVQDVDPQLLARLDGYHGAVDEQLSEVAREREHAAAWDRTQAQMSGRRRWLAPLLGFLLIGGPVILVSLGSAFLLSRGIIAQDRVQYVSFAAMGASMLGILAYFGWYYAFSKKKKSRRAAPAVTRVTCPSCGASSSMLAGQVLETCAHCGAALMPGEEVIERAVSSAREQARQARLERYRAERQGMATVQGAGISGTTLTFVVGGSLALPLVIGTVAFTAGMLAGSEPYSPGIFLLWAMCLAVVGAVAGFLWFQKRRRRRIRSGLEALVRAYQGRILSGLHGTVSWLNEHWAGPIEALDLTKGGYNDSAGLVVAGRHALVDLDPIAPSQHHRPRALLLVACDIPGTGAGQGMTLQLPPAARGLIQRIGDAGFTLEMQEGGLLARGDRLLTRAVATTDGTVEAFASPLADMAALARALEAGSPGQG
jgi:hypothetical protein